MLAIGGGLGTAWYMVEAGSRLSTAPSDPGPPGPRPAAPTPTPTRARTRSATRCCRSSSTLELTFRAKADSRGGRLHVGCEYAIVVEPLDGGGWWSLAAFDSQGGLIQNAAERYAFTSDTAMREPDGRAIITLARDARPGNWLPIGGGSRINLILTVQDAAWAAAVHEAQPPSRCPPSSGVVPVRGESDAASSPNG